MAAPKKQQPVSKPQPTLRGYPAWVLIELSAKKRTTPSELAATIIDQWVDGEQDYLVARSLGQQDFDAWSHRQPKNVLDYEAKKKKRD